MAEARALAESGQRIGAVAGAGGIDGRAGGDGMDGDRLSRASRRTRPPGLREVSASAPAGGQRRDRERDSPGDQFADEGQQYFLGAGKRGSDAGVTWLGIESPLEGSLCEDHAELGQ